MMRFWFKLRFLDYFMIEISVHRTRNYMHGAVVGFKLSAESSLSLIYWSLILGIWLHLHAE